LCIEGGTGVFGMVGASAFTAFGIARRGTFYYEEHENR
jgi:hypothetical protein